MLRVFYWKGFAFSKLSRVYSKTMTSDVHESGPINQPYPGCIRYKIKLKYCIYPSTLWEVESMGPSRLPSDTLSLSIC